MFIRTQDGKDLVNLDKVANIQVNGDSIYLNFGGEDEWILGGKYKNEKEAIKILNGVISVILEKTYILTLPQEDD